MKCCHRIGAVPVRIKALLVVLAVLAAAVALAACGSGGNDDHHRRIRGQAAGDRRLAALRPRPRQHPLRHPGRNQHRQRRRPRRSLEHRPRARPVPDGELPDGGRRRRSSSPPRPTRSCRSTARPGNINWTYTPEVDFSQSTGVGGYGVSVNRGVAAEGGKLFMLTFDDKLQAVEQKTGERLWSSTVADPATGAYESMAPTAYDGKVYVGDSGSEDGVRGFVAAYDQKTGKQLWKFYTVPKAGTGWVPKGGGGGTIYMPPTIDPKTGIVYVGTGNPAPVIVGAKRPGKNLYTDSLLALDANTGELLWYHQEQAHDLWDYDAESPVAPLQRRNRRAPPARRRRGGQERPALPARRENRQEPLPLGAVREARPLAADPQGDARVPRRGRRLAVLAARLQPGNAGGLRLRHQHLHGPQGRPTKRPPTARKPSAATASSPKTRRRPAPSPRVSTVNRQGDLEARHADPDGRRRHRDRRRPRLHRRPAGHPLRLRRRERRRPVAGRPETRLRHRPGRLLDRRHRVRPGARSAAPPSPPPKNSAKSAPAWWR